jgi:CRISPR-associated exonuclease Cas4
MTQAAHPNYKDEDLIMLSGLQHVRFCPRQFALIHVEQVWRENRLTAEGCVIHENAHDPYFTEKRGNLIITRSVPVLSYQLGLSGEADVIEWRHGDTGAKLKGREGLWAPSPIEYKRGKPKKDLEDEIQLCAQAMCIEEMLGVSIPKGYLYYWEIRSRTEVALTEELRQQVREAAEEAHRILQTNTLPPPDRPKKQCKNCSLADECLPGSKGKKSAEAYLRGQLQEQIGE